MYYVYVLASLKDKKFYTGFAVDLVKRIKRHNNGSVTATKNRRPFVLLYYEACLSKKDALHREIYLKSSWGKRFIKNRIKKGHSWIVLHPTWPREVPKGLLHRGR